MWNSKYYAVVDRRQAVVNADLREASFLNNVEEAKEVYAEADKTSKAIVKFNFNRNSGKMTVVEVLS